jgi:hypothetical protein
MVQNYNFSPKLNKCMLPHNFSPLFKKAGCSNVLLQPNNSLKHEIQIDNTHFMGQKGGGLNANIS